MLSHLSHNRSCGNYLYSLRLAYRQRTCLRELLLVTVAKVHLAAPQVQGVAVVVVVDVAVAGRQHLKEACQLAVQASLVSFIDV